MAIRKEQMIHPSPLPRSRPPRWLRPAQAILLAGGLAILGCLGIIVARAYFYQQYEGRRFDRMLQRARLAPARSRPPSPRMALAVHPSRHHPNVRPFTDESPIARLQIPSVGLDTLVLEGDSERILRLGAGHIPGTARPGEAGNIGIAGHRDTFFRALRKIEKNDLITLKTAYGTYDYWVEAVEVVDPAQVAVLEPTGSDTLTLVTCYPFYFIGPAPERFIVRARLMHAA